MTKKVYLAGPMSGLSIEQQGDWRIWCSRQLKIYGITSICPLRGNVDTNTTLSTNKGITSRDFFDVQSCDVILINLLKQYCANEISIGTCMEVAWAYSLRKPVVLAIDDENSPYDHKMIHGCSTYEVNSLTHAVETINNILGAYV